ncbi:hypothetical protein [Mesonia sp.]|uniref:DUF6922 domain-containing protein n=1 Tax=Mesonia sp. TaxID=1960830 RepID=UPI000C906126|nr:hypothetical protein [Mesonia sp.]MAN25756.1 hypothetical protein [Mesonia sp.]|tara:strand:- start:528 stop:815 length:288 start_codon:yes stop_codon:yes gene_type:complete
MEKHVNIAKRFPKHLFWDMDANRLSVEKDRSIIIPRALFATTKNSFEKDIQNLEKLYSKNEITSILRNTKENISNEVCILVAKRYKIKPFFRYSL